MQPQDLEIDSHDDQDAQLRADQTSLEKRDENFITQVIDKFRDLNRYAKVIQYGRNIDKQNDCQKVLICMEGEIGVGKSTTNNHVMHSYCQKVGGIDHTKYSFKFGRQCERVTTTVKTQQAGDLILMDTPGTNDFQSELSDYSIAKMKHQSLAQIFKTKGVSCITQCIMVDDGGRLKETSVESMAKTFHSLTYSFPDYDPIKNGGPRLNILFTKLSKFHDDPDDIMIEGLECANKYEMVNKFDELVLKFKSELSKKLHSDIYETESLERIEVKVDLILPNDHFYAFKIFPGMEQRMDLEKTEIERLIRDASNHGRWFIENKDSAQNTPTSFDLKQAKVIIDKIKSLNDQIMTNHIKISHDTFRSQTHDILQSQQIIDIEKEFQKGYSYASYLIEKSPWIFQRCPLEYENYLNKLIFHLPIYLKEFTNQQVKNSYEDNIKNKNKLIQDLRIEKQRISNENQRDKIQLIAKHNDELKKFEEKNLQKYQKIDEEHKKEIQVMENQKDIIQEKHRIEMQFEQKKIEISNKEIQDKNDKKISEMERQHYAEKIQQKNHYEIELQNLQKDYEDRLTSQAKEFSSKISKLEQEHLMHQTSLTNNHCFLVKKLETKLQEQKQDLMEEIKKLEHNLTLSKKQCEVQFKNQLNRQENESKKQLYVMQSQYEQKIKELQQDKKHLDWSEEK